MESKKFLREIFDIEEKAHNYIITLFNEYNFNELVLTDDSNEIIYITENNVVKCEKVKAIKTSVFNRDDIFFQTISGAYIPCDICVRGTIAQYAPIIEGEFERIKNTIETQNNNCQLGNIQPDYGVLKTCNYVDHIVELCPHCENEVVLDVKFQKQDCPICNKLIKPCSMCDICTNPCPLDDNE